MDAWDDLIRRPDARVVKIMDDETVKALMLRAGIGGYFKRKPGANCHAQYATFAKHPTHYILFGFYHGHPNPADNGYFATCLAKSHFTIEQANEGINRLLNYTMPNIDGAYNVPTDNEKFN